MNHNSPNAILSKPLLPSNKYTSITLGVISKGKSLLNSVINQFDAYISVGIVFF